MPPSQEKLARSYIKGAGLRVTKPRVQILSVLINAPLPLTIEAIHAELPHDNCDLVTVYRAIETFEKLGFVRRIFDGASALYSLSAGPPRYYVLSKDTGEIHSLDAQTAIALSEAAKRIEDHLRAKGYTEVSHVVQFFESSHTSPLV